MFKVIACVQNYASVTPGSQRDINKLLPGCQILTKLLTEILTNYGQVAGVAQAAKLDLPDVHSARHI